MVRLSDSREYEFYYGASPRIKTRAAELRKEMTEAEKMLWQHLRNRKMKGLKFQRQHPVHIFILDFYCHEQKLAIEVDGGIHKGVEQKERDKNRTFELHNIGISVLRFTNEEVEKHIHEVLKKIEKAVS